jgi:cytochrome c peroxidase
MTQAFARAYGGPPDGTRVVDALATFERTLVTPNSRFDAWLRGDDAALNQSELQGYKLFKSIGCASCHQGVNMGGNLFQVSGVFHPVTGTTSRLVRVPSLRNAAATAPYFHDGSAPTLEAAIRTMGRAQLDRTLTVAQIDQIAAFLRTQTGQYRGRLVTAHP